MYGLRKIAFGYSWKREQREGMQYSVFRSISHVSAVFCSGMPFIKFCLLMWKLKRFTWKFIGKVEQKVGCSFVTHILW